MVQPWLNSSWAFGTLSIARDVGFNIPLIIPHHLACFSFTIIHTTQDTTFTCGIGGTISLTKWPPTRALVSTIRIGPESTNVWSSNKLIENFAPISCRVYRWYVGIVTVPALVFQNQ